MGKKIMVFSSYPIIRRNILFFLNVYKCPHFPKGKHLTVYHPNEHSLHWKTPVIRFGKVLIGHVEEKKNAGDIYTLEKSTCKYYTHNQKKTPNFSMKK